MSKDNLTSFTKGLFRENPLLRLLAGICPALAVTTSAVNGVAMGLAVTTVLLFSNIIAAALKNIIPENIKLPSYLVIIAFFVSVEQLLFKSFFPELEKELGIFLPLIAVNCIILGRVKDFADKNTVVLSALDGLGMGIGFTSVLFIIGIVREILGNGTILSGIDKTLGAYIDLGTFRGFDFTYEIASVGFVPMTVFLLPAGGFFVFGMLLAAVNIISEKKNRSVEAEDSEEEIKEPAEVEIIVEVAENIAPEEAEEIKKATPDISEKISVTPTEATEKTATKELHEAAVEEAADVIIQESAKATVAEKVVTEELAAKEPPEEKAASAEAVTEKPVEATAVEEETVAEAVEEKTVEEKPVEHVTKKAAEIAAVSVTAEKPKTAVDETKEKAAEAKASDTAEKTKEKQKNIYITPPTKDTAFFEPKRNTSGKKSRKAASKRKGTATVQVDLSQPLPDVIPDFIKRDLENKKGGKEE